MSRVAGCPKFAVQRVEHGCNVAVLPHCGVTKNERAKDRPIAAATADNDGATCADDDRALQRMPVSRSAKVASTMPHH